MAAAQEQAAAQRLSTADMARFVANGFLAMPGVVPDEINSAFLALAEAATIPEVAPGVPLSDAWTTSLTISPRGRLPTWVVKIRSEPSMFPSYRARDWRSGTIL